MMRMDFRMERAYAGDNVTLDQAIDVAMRLSPEQRQMLVTILRQRAIEARREEIAREARVSLALFSAGRLRPQSAAEIIAQLAGEHDEE
jgi:hypothetical protein